MKEKKSAAERKLQKRIAERKRYANLKSDPVKAEEMKLKMRLKRQKSKENGVIKLISQMTPKERRAQRKKWKESALKFRQRKKNRKSLQTRQCVSALESEQVNSPTLVCEVPLIRGYPNPDAVTQMDETVKQEVVDYTYTDVGLTEENVHVSSDEWGANVKAENDSDLGSVSSVEIKQEVLTEDSTNDVNIKQHEDGAVEDIEVKYEPFPSNLIISPGMGFDNNTENTGGSLTTEDPDKPFGCQLCSYKCSRRYALETHMLVHTRKKRIGCDLCDYRCSQRGQLRAHVSNYHTGNKPLACNLCDYRCGLPGELKRHIRVHTGEKPFVCDVCDFRCSHMSAMRRHKRRHSGVKNHACDLCEYKCSDAGNLKKHIATHTGDKPYLCDMCDFRCSQPAQLKVHVRKHTGEKPFLCTVCDYASSQSVTLKAHMRTHTGETPYACSECDYKCKDSGTLKRHLTKHSGEKPFACKLCRYSCKLLGYLKRHHMRKHPGIDQSVAEVPTDFFGYT